jgi:hypothetical protein
MSSFTEQSGQSIKIAVSKSGAKFIPIITRSDNRSKNQEIYSYRPLTSPVHF